MSFFLLTKERIFSSIRANQQLFSIFAVIVAVQGVVVVAQLLVAFRVNPSDLGIIRWVESVFAIFLMLASWGMPPVLFRQAALYSDSAAHYLIFKRGAVISVSFSLLFITVAVFYWLFSRYLKNLDSRAIWLCAMGGVLLPASTSRIGVAIIQGAQLTSIYWRRLLLTSIISIFFLLLGVWIWGLIGWILARYVSEFLLVSIVFFGFYYSKGAGSIATCRDVLLDFSRLIHVGAIANVALLTRTIADNFPILLLGIFASNADELGYWGLTSLFVFAPQLLLSVYAQNLTPQLVRSFKEAELEGVEILKIARRSFLRVGILAASLFCVISLLLTLLPGSRYMNAWSTIFVVGLFFPVRAVLAVNGAVLMALPNYRAALLINIIEVIVLLVFVVVFKTGMAMELALFCGLASVFGAAFSMFFTRSKNLFP